MDIIMQSSYENLMTVKSNMKRKDPEQDDSVLISSESVEESSSKKIKTVNSGENHLNNSSSNKNIDSGEEDNSGKENEARSPNTTDATSKVGPLTNRRKKKTDSESDEKNSQSDASVSSPKKPKLTPAEREAKKQQLEEEKKVKQQEKEEAKKKRDEERLKKQEEKEKEMKRKEELKKQKEEQKKQKEEDKKKKEEEKKKKDEEKEEIKRKKEEEKKKKEEEKKRKEELKEQLLKQKEDEKRKQSRITAFVSNSSATSTTASSTVQKPSQDAVAAAPKCWYGPFEIGKKIMAPYGSRIHSLSCDEIEEEIRNGADKKALLIQFVTRQSQKQRSIEPAHDSSKSSSQQHKTNSLLRQFEEIPHADVTRRKMKLLSFYDNRRPSYYGTWSKKSTIITGRRPFAQDKTLLDYEFNSDSEWEDEPEDGEDLRNEEDDSEAEKEEEEEENEDGFLVPDGYFSEDEGFVEEEQKMYSDGSEQQLEKQQKLKELAKKMKEMEGKKGILNPVVVGVVFDVTEDHTAYSILKRFEVKPLKSVPIDVTCVIPRDRNDEKVESSSGADHPHTPRGRKVKGVSDDLLPELVKFIHGNHSSLATIMTEFQKQHETISKSQLEKKIKEIAIKGKGKSGWIVKEEVLKSLNISVESLPTTPQPLKFVESTDLQRKYLQQQQQRQQQAIQQQQQQQPTTVPTQQPKPVVTPTIRRITPIRTDVTVASTTTATASSSMTSVIVPSTAATVSAQVKSPSKQSNTLETFIHRSPTKETTAPKEGIPAANSSKMEEDTIINNAVLPTRVKPPQRRSAAIDFKNPRVSIPQQEEEEEDDDFEDVMDVSDVDDMEDDVVSEDD